MTILPEPGNPSDQWVLGDYRQTPAISSPAVAGVATVAFGPVPDDELWLLDRITVSCTSSTVTVCTLYLDVIDPQHALDYTPAGNYDIADEASPIQIPATSQLLVVWTGASNGARASARTQMRILRRIRGR